ILGEHRKRISSLLSQLRVLIWEGTIRSCMTRITSLAICAFMLMLQPLLRSTLAPPATVPHPPPAGLKQEIERVQAEIDKIFAETLAQLPSIPGDSAHRMKRVQTLGKLLLF